MDPTDDPPGTLVSGTLPTLEASRLRLRWLDDHDVPDLYEVFSDPEVMRYWSRPPMTSPAEAEALVGQIRSHFAAGNLFQWGVALADNDRVIGTVTLASIHRESRRAEVGYALGRSAWGHGYAEEALRRLLAHAFGAIDLHRVEADVDPRNARSIRSLERLGFTREGLLRERWIVGGEICDALFYGLLAREYAP